MYRYRVQIVRARGDSSPLDPELRECVQLHAPNAIAAQLLARAVTGAACALEPERLGEVDAPRPTLATLSPHGGCVLFA